MRIKEEYIVPALGASRPAVGLRLCDQRPLPDLPRAPGDSRIGGGGDLLSASSRPGGGADSDSRPWPDHPHLLLQLRVLLACPAGLWGDRSVADSSRLCADHAATHRGLCEGAAGETGRSRVRRELGPTARRPKRALLWAQPTQRPPAAALQGLGALQRMLRVVNAGGIGGPVHAGKVIRPEHLGGHALGREWWFSDSACSWNGHQ